MNKMGTLLVRTIAFSALLSCAHSYSAYMTIKNKTPLEFEVYINKGHGIQLGVVEAKSETTFGDVGWILNNVQVCKAGTVGDPLNSTYSSRKSQCGNMKHTMVGDGRYTFEIVDEGNPKSYYLYTVSKGQRVLEAEIKK